MKLSIFQRVAAIALTATLLTAAGQGAAIASDPQWESAQQSGSQSDPQWESAPLTATLP